MYAFEFTLNDEDYFEFNKYHTYHSPANRKNVIIARFVYPVIFMLLAVFYAVLFGNPVISFVVFGCISLSWLIFFNKIVDRRLRKIIASLKKKGKLPYHQATAIRFEDEMIIEHTESSDMQIKYSAIEHIGADENAVYVFYSVTQAFIIPLRAFKDDAEQKRFLDFINTKTKGQAT